MVKLVGENEFVRFFFFYFALYFFNFVSQYPSVNVGVAHTSFTVKKSVAVLSRLCLDPLEL